MLIATFGPTTGWVGKTITYESERFVLEGHGPIAAQDLVEYDRQGHIEWAYDGLREWACQLCEQAPAAEPVLFQGMSHESGRNAVVTLYRNRIERVKQRSRASLSKAHQDVEVTPMKAVTSVRAQKDGMLRTKVTVYAAANAIDFRFEHAEAHAFKDAIMALVLENS